MIELDPSRFKSKPFAHQLDGIKALVRHPAFALFDEMGVGKSKQVIDSACTLAVAGEIDTVVIVAPASVRTVWLDPQIGEIRKHSWLPSWVAEFHSKSKIIWQEESPKIQWLVSNYELLRSAKWLEEMLGTIKGRNVFLVLDESSYIKSRTAQQTKAIMKLRRHCKRVVLLNGTPLTHSPIDLFSQMKVLDPKILGDNFYAFRAEYCEMVPKRFGTGRSFMQVVGFKNLDKLTARCAPYVLRRLKKDVLDLPDKLYTFREVALSKESWKRYQELKREAVASLPGGDMQLEPNAAVRIMRLAQLTSGHLGALGQITVVNGDLADNAITDEPPFAPVKDVHDISSEKLDFCVQYLTEECQARYVIVWCRWRRERERLVKALFDSGSWKGNGNIYEIYGGQSRDDRDHAVAVFSNPCTHEEERPRVLLAQPHAGGFGLNLVAASEVIYLSNDWSLGIRLQSEDRCHRPGQRNAVTYTDVLATGPAGQKTIDHTIYAALQAKQHLLKLTTEAWRKELE